MKSLIKNSLLVTVLAVLMLVPFMGFGFVEEESFDTNVLGSKTVFNQNSKSENTNILSKTGNVEVIDQLGFNLNLSRDRVQEFYGLISDKYLSTEYDVIPVLPQDLKDAGMFVTVDKTSNSGNITITLPRGLDIESVDLVLVVVR